MNNNPTVPLPEYPAPSDAAHETLPLEHSLLSSTEAPAALAGASAEASAPLPRTRWAAIVWGLCFAGLAWFGIWMLSGADRRDDVTDGLASLDPGTITAFVLLTVGVLVLITGLVGLIRRAQRHLGRQG